MLSLKRAVSSTLGKKFLMSISGLALGLFVIMHLLGNLQLLLPEGSKFNQYADNLEKFGILLYLAEIGLLAMVLLHIVTAVQLKFGAKRARGTNYSMTKSKNGPSKNNISSRNMIVSGVILLAFLVFHIWQFKFGPGKSSGYVAQVNGEEVRDLFRLVVETFQNPLYVFIYVAVMIFLGAHLKHGYWSLFQSAGATNPRISGPLYCAGALLAVALAVGFILLPLWIYFDLGHVLGVFK